MKLITFVYKWTNIETGEYYTGVHKGSVDDGYVGSGKKFMPKYKKYPHRWQREIVQFFENYHDALELESKLVTEELIKTDPLCLNLKRGGEGGGSLIKDNETKEKHSARMKQRWADEEQRTSLIKKLKSRWTEEYKEKRQSDGSIGFCQEKIDRKKSVETRRNGAGYGQSKGSKRSLDVCEILSQKAKQRQKVECPHCRLVGAKPQMARWHFENCKELRNP